MIATHKMVHYRKFQKFQGILMISAGDCDGDCLLPVLWLGYKLDEYFGTAPNFMFGLFFLAIFICVMRLYQEAKQKMKEL
jgi:hypothetical protein